MANKDGAQQSALEKFFAGKGFYIVLFLCAAVIGVSAWTLLSREGAVDETMDDYRPAVTAPAPTKQAWDEDDGDAQDVIAQPPETVSETPMVQPTPEPTVAPTPTPEPADAAPTSWLWPVYGAIARQHSVDTLVYDDTMGDWRTHAGVDIDADLGAYVMASADGACLESAARVSLYNEAESQDSSVAFRWTYDIYVNNKYNSSRVLGTSLPIAVKPL